MKARLTVLVVAGGCVAGLAVPALASMMHPKLAARLAGMGEHGIVNLTSNAKAKKLCWTFELPTTKGITGASIHVGSKGVVVIKLGSIYKAKGCASASAMTLEHLESKPGA